MSLNSWVGKEVDMIHVEIGPDQRQFLACTLHHRDVGILNTEVNRWLCARQSGWFGFRTDGALDPLRLLPVVLVGLLQQEVLLGLGLWGEPHRHHGLLQTACFLA